jgi:thiamine biosynthesis lipoprotein
MAPDVAGPLPEAVPAPGWRSVILDAEHSTVVLRPGTVLDLGATAKAWASDLAAQLIASRLGCGTLVSLGGDITVAGPAPERGFAVGIADICGDPSAPITVAIESGGLATSGIGNRHWCKSGHPVHHLVDPATGLPVETPWRTVSVTAGSCVDANTASTAAMVMGEAAVGWLDEARLPSRLVRRDGGTVVVAGWPDQDDQADPDSLTGGSKAALAP